MTKHSMPRPLSAYLIKYHSSLEMLSSWILPFRIQQKSLIFAASLYSVSICLGSTRK